MAEQLNVEQPPYGGAGELEMAAQAAQMPTQTVAGNPEAAQAIEQSAQEAQAQPAAAPAPATAQPTRPEMPANVQFTGILQAPAVMQQPMRAPIERDQQVQMMWDVMAKTGGTALTQMIASELSGVD